MFASRTTEDMLIEDGVLTCVVTLQKLSARSLDKASEVRQGTVAAASRQLGGDLIKAFNEASVAAAAAKPDAKPKAKTIEERREERYAMYDRDTVLQAGIARWTAQTPEGKPLAVKDGVGDLVEPVAVKIYRRLIDMSLPELDEAVDESNLVKS